MARFRMYSKNGSSWLFRSEHGDRFTSSGDDDALTSLRATIEIYGRLLTHDPGRVIAEILDGPLWTG